ncbi:MAG: glycerate kinase [Chitinophagaceae bacterium]
MKIIIAPDKFKGSLTSFEVAKAVTDGLLTADDRLDIYSFPMADGGDGFAEVISYYTGAQLRRSMAEDALGKPIEATWQWQPDTATAIIEVAAASGLVLLPETLRNPLHTSTYGTGLQAKTALEAGAQTIVLGLGGSGTNDGGAGILAAWGFQLLDAGGQLLPPTGQSLLSVKKIIPPARLPAINWVLACDVDNPLTGPNGAAVIYAPQKGATDDQVIQLEAGLKNWAAVLKQQTGIELEGQPSLGAAGGIAAGLKAFFPVTIRQGIEMVVAASGLRDVLTGADLLITGEGKLDNQTASGKVVGYMARMAKEAGIACHAICGQTELNAADLKGMGIDKAVSLVGDDIDSRQAIAQASLLIKEKARQLL